MILSLAIVTTNCLASYDAVLGRAKDLFRKREADNKLLKRLLFCQRRVCTFLVRLIAYLN